MKPFHVAITGDFLNAEGRSAYGRLPLTTPPGVPYLTASFLADQAPVPNDPIYWERLGALEVRPDHLRGINGLVVLRPWVRRATLAAAAAELVVIGRSGAGYDKVDVAACTEHDVALFNAPFALNHATASTALLFILALAKRLPEQDRLTRAGQWDLTASVMGDEIEGGTLGIVGLGHSGRELVRLAAPFRMRVLAYSPHADPAQAEALGVRLTSLEELLPASDFVSIHCRLSEASRGLIGAAQLALMKPSAYLVNIARGEVVDQPALTRALAERRIRGAALDVFYPEPLPATDPLLQLDNVIVTPHWSASTSDVWQATGAAMAAGMQRAARGQVPEHVVNPEVLERPGFRRKLARFAENAAEPPAAQES